MVYSKNEIIEMAVQIEKSGYAYYNKALERKDLSEAGKRMITLLRDQEVNHEKYFISLRDEEDLSQISDSGDWELIAEYIKIITDSRLFNDEASAVNLATEAQTEKDIFEYAIRFEKDTILFFHTIKDNLKDSKTIIALKKIIDEEITHILRLTEYIQAIIKE